MKKPNVISVVVLGLISTWCVGASVERKKGVLVSLKARMVQGGSTSGMPFNETIKKDFIATLDRIIGTGVFLNQTADSNSLMSLCVQQKNELLAGSLGKDDVALAQRFIKQAAKNPFYSEALSVAKKSSKVVSAPKDYSKKCWLSFQKDALEEIVKVVQEGTTIVMKGRVSTIQHMLASNRYLSAAEQQRYRAGLIGLFLTVQTVHARIKHC